MTQFLALRQRYLWSVALFEQVRGPIEQMTRGEQIADGDTQRVLGLLSFWLASLWVLVEGWKELGLSHSGVDPYLADSRLALLRRFRHYVFHFQSDYDSPKQRDLYEEQGAHLTWVLTLASTLNDVFLPHYHAPDPARLLRWVMFGDPKLD